MIITFRDLYHNLFISESIKTLVNNIDIKSKDIVRIKNVKYGKDAVNNIFDFYFPKGEKEKYPTVFLIHGGGYVSGQKEDLNRLVLNLVNNGYGVVNIEYTKSDGIENKYMPTPIYEVFDVFKFIENHKKFNDYIDYNNVFIAGDSSGAHIASLVANIQSNPNLKLDFNLTGGPQIKGIILTCPVFGAYNFANFPIKHDFHKVVYGYNNDLKEICHNFNITTELFPPAILISTQKDIIARIHTNMFIKKSKELNLSLDFYDIKKAYKLGHNSMIKYADIYSNYTNAVLNFLDNAVNNKFVKGVRKTDILEIKKPQKEQLEK